VSIYGSGHMMLYVMKRHFLDWRTSVAIHKKVEQVLIQAAMVDLHGVCMGFFPSNSNGISFAAQLHDDTSIELRHQTLHLTRTTSSLMCKPLQFHYGTNSYHSSYLDVTRFIQILLTLKSQQRAFTSPLANTVVFLTTILLFTRIQHSSPSMRHRALL